MRKDLEEWMKKDPSSRSTEGDQATGPESLGLPIASEVIRFKNPMELLGRSEELGSETPSPEAEEEEIPAYPPIEEDEVPVEEVDSSSEEVEKSEDLSKLLSDLSSAFVDAEEKNYLFEEAPESSSQVTPLESTILTAPRKEGRSAPSPVSRGTMKLREWKSVIREINEHLDGTKNKSRRRRMLFAIILLIVFLMIFFSLRRSAENLCRRGDSFFQEERYEQALVYYQRSAGKDPDLKSALRGIALTLERLGRRGEALDAFYRVLQIDPEDAEIHTKIGVILLRLSSYEKARNAFQQALQIDSDNVQAIYGLAKVLYAEDDLDDARSQLVRLLHIRKDHSEAVDLLQKIDEKMKSDEPDLFPEEKMVSPDVSSEDTELPLDPLSADVLSPGLSVDYFISEDAVSDSGDIPFTEHVAISSVDLASDDLSQELVVGKVFPDSSDFSDIVAVSDDLKERVFEDKVVAVSDDLKERVSKDKVVAVSDDLRKKMAEHVPSSMKTINSAAERGRTLRLAKRNSQTRSRSVLVEPIEKRAKRYFEAGRLYGRRGDLVRSARYYSRALALSPDMTAACNNLGWTYNNLKDYGAVLTLLNSFVDQKGESAALWSNMGYAYTMTGDHRQARRSFLRSLCLADDATEEMWAPVTVRPIDKGWVVKRIDLSADLRRRIVRPLPKIESPLSFEVPPAFEGGMDIFLRAMRLNPEETGAYINLYQSCLAVKGINEYDIEDVAKVALAHAFFRKGLYHDALELVNTIRTAGFDDDCLESLRFHITKRI